MSSEKLKDKLEKKLHARVRCSLAAGMWIIEAIISTLDLNNRHNLLSEIRDIVAKHSPENSSWKILLYSDSRQRFNVDGTLKTSEPTPTTSLWRGTIPLMASDCFVWLTEYDGEVLRFGDDISGITVYAIESTNTDGVPILPYQTQKYLYLVTKGQVFALGKDGVKANTSTVPNEIQIKLK